MAPSGLGAQGQVSVRVAENFRREPNGVVLARLEPGTRLRALSRNGNWTQVELEGWVWLRSLEASTEEPGLDLVVAADGGENLRSGPSGTILGRLEEGALLVELSRDPGWARVSRLGWIWSASVTELASGAASEPPPAVPASGGRAGAGTSAAPSSTPARAESRFTTVGAGGGAILSAPDGDTMAIARPARELELIRREGNWIRVRLEGWLWQPSAAEVEATVAAPAADLSPADLKSDPEAHAGRVVQWIIQFISLERAEAVRTDFFQGEPFLLARYGGGDGPFVYVAVSPERLAEVEGLLPLERIRVTGRVRTGSSALTGAPIIDLIELQRSREAP